MMTSCREKWLFFDVGSTLVDERKAYADFVDRCVGRLRNSGVEVSIESFSDKMVEVAKDGGDAIRGTWDLFAPKELVRPRWSHDKESLYSDAAIVLNSLKSRYYLGIIANQGPGLDERLEAFGIASYFDLIIGSSDVGLTKPHLDIFRNACQKVGISPKNACYIGDRVDCDIIPAKKLGMCTIRVLQGLGQYQPESLRYPSDYQIKSLTDLLHIL